MSDPRQRDRVHNLADTFTSALETEALYRDVRQQDLRGQSIGIALARDTARMTASLGKSGTKQTRLGRHNSDRSAEKHSRGAGAARAHKKHKRYPSYGSSDSSSYEGDDMIDDAWEESGQGHKYNASLEHCRTETESNRSSAQARRDRSTRILLQGSEPRYVHHEFGTFDRSQSSSQSSTSCTPHSVQTIEHGRSFHTYWENPKDTFG